MRRPYRLAPCKSRWDLDGRWLSFKSLGRVEHDREVEMTGLRLAGVGNSENLVGQRSMRDGVAGRDVVGEVLLHTVVGTGPLGVPEQGISERGLVAVDGGHTGTGVRPQATCLEGDAGGFVGVGR